MVPWTGLSVQSGKQSPCQVGPWRDFVAKVGRTEGTMRHPEMSYSRNLLLFPQLQGWRIKGGVRVWCWESHPAGAGAMVGTVLAGTKGPQMESLPKRRLNHTGITARNTSQCPEGEAKQCTGFSLPLNRPPVLSLAKYAQRAWTRDPKPYSLQESPSKTQSKEGESELRI